MTENETRALIEALDRMQEKNRIRSIDAFAVPIASWSILEWAGAMCGEAGEAANIAKKIRRDGASPELTQKLSRELADVIAYAALLAEAAGLSLGECVVVGFNAVSDRAESEIYL